VRDRVRAEVRREVRRERLDDRGAVALAGEVGDRDVGDESVPSPVLMPFSLKTCAAFGTPMPIWRRTSRRLWPSSTPR
jgi:hypothetical protein